MRRPDDPGRGADPNGLSAELDQLERMASWLDSRFVIPGLNIRFGLDSVLGLVPGLGDTLTVLPAAYIVLRGRQLGAPVHMQGRMVINALIDWLAGSIPVVGDLFDVGFKANRRNVALLRAHFASADDMIDVTPNRAGSSLRDAA